MDKELKDRFEKIDTRLDDFEDNHLRTIEAWVLYLANDVSRLWKVFGMGIAILAVVIAIVEVLG